MREKKQNVKRLGELLVESGLITDEQLNSALEEQKKTGGLIGEILVSWGHTTEESIVQALSSQYGFPFIQPTLYKTDDKIIKLIPKEFASRYSLVGLDKIGSSLVVAMSNPLDQEPLDQMEEMTQCSLHVFITTYTEVMRTIERQYMVRKPGST